MPQVSHIDLATFVRYLHFPVDVEGATKLEKVAAMKDPRDAFHEWLETYSPTSESGRVQFHETYHYWQGLKYPFLQLYSIFCFSAQRQAFRILSRRNSDYSQWGGVSVPASDYVSKKFLCAQGGPADFECVPDVEITMPNGLNARQVTDLPNWALLSVIDLMEGAATMAEWQIAAESVAQIIQPQAFHRWRKRNRAGTYTVAFEFLARALNSDSLALRCFTSLVETSFKTNHPVIAFVRLIAMINITRDREQFAPFYAQDEPCRWGDFFDHLQSLVKFDALPDSVKTLSHDAPFCRLDIRTWATFKWDGFGGHPTLSKNTAAWLAREAEQPELKMVLPQIGWVKRSTFDKCLGDFPPPLTVVTVEFPEGGRRAFCIGNKDALNLHNVPAYAFFALHSAARRATGTGDGSFRSCHHKDCTEYDNNFCGAFPFIPNAYKDCGFPMIVRKLISEDRLK